MNPCRASCEREQTWASSLRSAEGQGEKKKEIKRKKQDDSSSNGMWKQLLLNFTLSRQLNRWQDFFSSGRFEEKYTAESEMLFIWQTCGNSWQKVSAWYYRKNRSTCEPILNHAGHTHTWELRHTTHPRGLLRWGYSARQWLVVVWNNIWQLSDSDDKPQKQMHYSTEDNSETTTGQQWHKTDCQRNPTACEPAWAVCTVQYVP